MIRILPPDDPAPLLRAAARPDGFDWIVFTSANAVECVHERAARTATATSAR